MGGISLDRVQSFLAHHLNRTEYRLFRAFFSNDVNLADLPSRIALMHVGTDLYMLTKEAKLLFERVSSGGVVRGRLQESVVSRRHESCR
jgi:hypothetical protein